MLLKHINLLHFNCNQARFIGLHHFKWESATNRLKSLRQGKIRYGNYAMLAYLFILILQGYFLIFREINFKEKVSYLISVFIGAAIFAYNLSVQAHSLSVCTYINSLLDFYNNVRSSYSLFRYPGNTSKPTLLEIISVQAAYGFVAFSIALPILLHFGIHWQNPCYISLAGYWCIPKCNMDDTEYQQLPYWFATVDAIIHVVVVCLNYWYWIVGFNSAALYTSVLMILCTLSLVKNLKL